MHEFILPEHKTEGITAIRFLSATRATKLRRLRCTELVNHIFVQNSLSFHTAELSSNIRVHSSWKRQDFAALLLLPHTSAFVFIIFISSFWNFLNMFESSALNALIMMPQGLRGWRWRVENLIPFPKPPGHVWLDQSHFNANTLGIPGCKAGSAYANGVLPLPSHLFSGTFDILGMQSIMPKHWCTELTSTGKTPARHVKLPYFIVDQTSYLISSSRFIHLQFAGLCRIFSPMPDG